MQAIFGLHRVKKISTGSVITIGIFDGVHKGHQEIIKRAVKRARKAHYKSVVLTFYPHPARLLNKRETPALLISLKHRLSLMECLGADICVVINFNKRFSRFTAQEFVEKILVKKMNVKSIFIGQDFLFGRNAAGNVHLVKEMAKVYRFEVVVVKDVYHKGFKISSTYIRRLIEKGNLKKASRLLSRPVSILGTVVRGSSRGRLLGYPTANINPHHEAIPPTGVYAVVVKFKHCQYRGILNIGLRPTFKSNNKKTEPTIEVHIFNFNKNIYGQDLEIAFVERIRDERKFARKEDLIKQLKIDETKARNIFFLTGLANQN